MMDRPYIVGGMALFGGYVVAFLSHADRPVSPELMRFHRREQMLKLRAIVSSLCRFRKIKSFELLSTEANPALRSPAK